MSLEHFSRSSLARLRGWRARSSRTSACLLHWYHLVQTLPIMLQPRIRCPSAAIDSSFASLAASLSALSLCRQHAKSTRTTFVRHASHAAQGRANGPKDSAGRRLGAKKTASQYVIPGNIIFKQRGIFPRPWKHKRPIKSVKLT